MREHRDAACALCDRLPSSYWMLYDHVNCGLPKGAILFIGSCSAHEEGVGDAWIRRHLQCMGWPVPAASIEDIVESREIPTT